MRESSKYAAMLQKDGYHIMLSSYNNGIDQNTEYLVTVVDLDTAVMTEFSFKEKETAEKMYDLITQKASISGM